MRTPDPGDAGAPSIAGARSAPSAPSAAVPTSPDSQRPPVPFAAPGLILFVAVSAMSFAGPLVRLSSAPALAISAWRLLLSTAFILLILLLRGELRALRLSGRDWGLALAAGLLLAGHFWSWIASLELTSVASSVVLVNTQPVMVGLLSVFVLHERPTRMQWLGIVVAVAGAMVIGWGDFGRGRSPLLGDLLAVAGAAFVSGYYIIGRQLRPRLPLWSYTGVVYGIAALALATAVLLSPGVPAVDYPASDWLIFLALAAGPMMLGHTGVNYALRFLPAYVANVALLGEPVGATIIAWLLPAIHERPPAQTLVGGVLVLGGIALGWRRARRASPAEATGRAPAPPERLSPDDALPSESAMDFPEKSH